MQLVFGRNELCKVVLDFCFTALHIKPNLIVRVESKDVTSHETTPRQTGHAVLYSDELLQAAHVLQEDKTDTRKR